MKFMLKLLLSDNSTTKNNLSGLASMRGLPKTAFGRGGQICHIISAKRPTGVDQEGGA
jgi:hypothetical protein